MQSARLDDNNTVQRSEKVTVRLSFIAAGFYVFWSFGASVLLAAGFSLLRGGNTASKADFIVGAVVWALFLLPVPFIRCRLDEKGVFVRNYFRSYSFRWDEVTSVELVRAGILTVDTSFNAYPRFHLRSGQRVDLRAAIHMRRKRADRLAAVVDEGARTFAFPAEIDAISLTG